jgi:putative SOS response-associated peptidase YedK
MTGGDIHQRTRRSYKMASILCNPHKDAAEPLAPIHERSPILLSSSFIAEWLNPDNLEVPDNTTQALLKVLAEESDQVAAEVGF